MEMDRHGKNKTGSEVEVIKYDGHRFLDAQGIIWNEADQVNIM